MHYLEEIVSAQNRGEALGIPSICSAHPMVLEASILFAKNNHSFLLIESTCNQVNQYRGYTGMTPVDFVNNLNEMADRLEYPRQRLILGGDHLGPEVWKDEPSKTAMEKAKRLVMDYVMSGYDKIHLDASMKLGDDPDGPLSKEIVAKRSAELAEVVEDSFLRRGSGYEPLYVIGTAVPVPGGGREGGAHLPITNVSAAAETIRISQQAFKSKGLNSAWDRVIALVVHPGVEFGDDFILEYERPAAKELSEFIETEKLVYEAHSTDYQKPAALRQMVEDHFAIQKVGPALTFAYREAVFALAMIEDQLIGDDERSNIIEVMDHVMRSNPKYWEQHYQGDLETQRFARKFSLSDRIRYYWPDPKVQEALNKLLQNAVTNPPPLELISKHLPVQCERILKKELRNNPHEIILDKISEVLRGYWKAANLLK